MARRRFFVEQVQSGFAEMTGDGAHHLTRVLRVEKGQTFEITDNDRVWLATVESARRGLVRFEITEELDAGPAASDVTLYLALIKFDRFEWAVEKATELGVTRIVPIAAARSERGLFEGGQKRAERWRRIAQEASEQSRRLRVPEIQPPSRLVSALAETAALRFWCDEQPGAPTLAAELPPDAASEPTAVLIGPEGGWTDTERGQFTAAGWRGISLGPLVLRTETAVCAALAVIAQRRLPSASSLQSKLE